jgi:hypothetical protein
MSFNKRLQPLLAALIVVTAPAGVPAAEPIVKDPEHRQFQNYWYPKGAEISRFRLSQSRYGENHSGDAVFVFVTESMNPELQVKADNPDKNDIPVLKLNATRKFYTGVYPYSIMTSVFAPVDTQRYHLPLKISFSSQEWCGHVYMQMNLRDNRYRIRSHSYFEQEADQDHRIDAVFPEDAVWTLIRTAPSRLPQGAFHLLPGPVYLRLKHRPLQAVPAVGKLASSNQKSLEGNALVAYELLLPEENRTLIVLFERHFPHRIQQWEDTYPGPGGRLLTTRAVRTHTIMSDYWNQHGNDDRRLLKKLGLDADRPG